MNFWVGPQQPDIPNIGTAGQKSHDLFDFMRQITDDMSAEYERIRKRTLEDPGTAGDQGEENWAELIRDWIPRAYEVVTKGRIISQDGVTSPQLDVLVLNSAYPKKLLNKKLYLAAGVAAAFECKTTLKASHVAEAAENCVKVKNLYQARVGTPYKELNAPFVYGLLAHSHVWKDENSTPEQNIERELRDSDLLQATHPRLQLDVICVADLAAWTSFKVAFMGPRQVPEQAKPKIAEIYGPNGSAATSYVGHTHTHPHQVEQFTPIGVLISDLSQRLAWENTSFRGLADYYRIANLGGAGVGEMRMWPSSIYSNDIRAIVEGGSLSNGKPWDEWSVAFP